MLYTRGEIKHWLTVFTRRFFSNQFQALGHAERPEGAGRRLAVSRAATWRMPSTVMS